MFSKAFSLADRKDFMVMGETIIPFISAAGSPYHRFLFFLTKEQFNPNYQLLTHINSLPNDNISGLSKSRPFADDKIEVTENLKFVL